MINVRAADSSDTVVAISRRSAWHAASSAVARWTMLSSATWIPRSSSANDCGPSCGASTTSWSGGLVRGRTDRAPARDAGHDDAARRRPADLGAWFAHRFAAALSIYEWDVRTHSPYAATDDSEPEPDVQVSRKPKPRGGHPTSAVLIVEVSRSSLRKDRKLTLPIYAENGVPENWIVDLARARGRDLHRAHRRHVRARRARRHDGHAAPALRAEHRRRDGRAAVGRRGQLMTTSSPAS